MAGSVQISPYGFVSVREKNWRYRISRQKLGHFEIPTSKTYILSFLANKRLLAEKIYITFLIYLKAIYGQKWKK